MSTHFMIEKDVLIDGNHGGITGFGSGIDPTYHEVWDLYCDDFTGI